MARSRSPVASVASCASPQFDAADAADTASSVDRGCSMFHLHGYRMPFSTAMGFCQELVHSYAFHRCLFTCVAVFVFYTSNNRYGFPVPPQVFGGPAIRL